MANEKSIYGEGCTTHRRIAGREFLHLEIAAGRPVSRRHTLRRGLGLVLDLEVLFDTLQTVIRSVKWCRARHITRTCCLQKP